MAVHAHQAPLTSAVIANEFAAVRVRVVRCEIEVRGVAARQSWAIDAALGWLSRDPALFSAFSSVTVGLADVERALLALGGEAGGPRPVHAVVRPNGG
jgi:hypothetical protein